jgi:glycosyltransferase involved in cell wall biosynthesis
LNEIEAAGPERVVPAAPGRSAFVVWAPWERATRSAWLARELGMPPPYYLTPTRRRGLRAAPLKYPRQLIGMIWLLARLRPQVVFVQSPPSFSAWAAAAWGLLSGASFVIDAHSDAFERSIWTRPEWLTRFVARRAAVTIVTNSHWAEFVTRWGGRPLVIPTIPTDVIAGDPPALADGLNALVVNTWAPDEPLTAVLDAAGSVPDVTFHVTGRIEKLATLQRPIPPNVRFTGFLAESAYHGLVAAADVVICLTTRDHTMQNGACEAMFHATPIITSDWAELREYFNDGTIHVDNTAAGIERGLRDFAADPTGYRAGIRRLRDRRRAEWRDARRVLLEMIAPDGQRA